MVEHGILKAFNAGAFTATVQMTGSLAQWLTAVPVSRGIASGEMVAGRKVAVCSTPRTPRMRS